MTPTTQLNQDSLKLVIVGHVDHGKSSLVGRLLLDTSSMPEDRITTVQAACKAEQCDFEPAFLLDSLLEEQKQNVTIDTTRVCFRSRGRTFQIIDAPGHVEFLKNMITGAAAADVAILVIDASDSIQAQTRRHAVMLTMLGVSHVLVLVNKMDRVAYSMDQFEALKRSATELLASLGMKGDPVCVPVAAKTGLNIATRDAEFMPWYLGPSLLDLLHELPARQPKSHQPLRFLVQDIYRFDHRRIIAGRVLSGTLRVGDELVIAPDFKCTRVKTFETWPDTASAKVSASAGESVAITLEEQVVVERGHIGSHRHDCPAHGREIEATVFWFQQESCPLRQPLRLLLGTEEVEAQIIRVSRLWDSATLQSVHRTEINDLKCHEIADVVLRTKRPIAFDQFDRIQETGRFVLMAGTRIGGGGTVRKARYSSPMADHVTSSNITWTQTRISREQRFQALNQSGVVIWMTGLSGSGKSTIAVALDTWLHHHGHYSFILDGDNVRHGLCRDLGFSAKDRNENIRRVGEVAKLMAEAGLIVICSLISPFRSERDHVRNSCEADGVSFVEVFVNAPLAECERRDPRGLYRKARAGEIKDFTGIDSPYEVPGNPELVLPTGHRDVIECLDMITERISIHLRPERLATDVDPS